MKVTTRISETGKYKNRAGAGKYYSEFSNVVTILSTCKNVLRLEELTPHPEEFGIFEFMRNEGTSMSTFLNNLLEPLGIDDLVSMDVEYIYNRSGRKSVSTLVKTFLQRINKKSTVEYPITIKDFTTISAIIRARYLSKWEKVWATMSYDFDPLAPYTFNQHEKVEKDHTVMSDENEFIDEGSDKSFTYGYNDNGEDGSPTERTVDESTSLSTTNHTRDNEFERDVTRKGNIGNRTNQELVRQQRDLLMFQFFDVVFDDVDRILTMSIYQ